MENLIPVFITCNYMCYIYKMMCVIWCYIMLDWQSLYHRQVYSTILLLFVNSSILFYMPVSVRCDCWFVRFFTVYMDIISIPGLQIRWIVLNWWISSLQWELFLKSGCKYLSLHLGLVNAQLFSSSPNCMMSTLIRIVSSRVRVSSI